MNQNAPASYRQAEAPTGPVTGPPSTVRYAMIAWVIAAVAHVVAAGLSILAVDAMLGHMTTWMHATSGSDRVVVDQAVDSMRNMMAAGVYCSVAFEVVLGAVIVFVATRMRSGRNWARVTLTVIGALQAMSGLSVVGFVAFGIPIAVIVVGVIASISVVTAIVLMWLAPSNAYFAALRWAPPRY